MTEGICIMCKQDIDDIHRFGDKITFKDVTAHHFCLLFSGKLAQNGADDEGISGFLINDIKREAKRAKRLRCTFCNEIGANISCCDRFCRKSFHYPCASKRDCLFEFADRFQSFCESHHNIKMPVICHKPTELCTICYDEMGEYNIIQSIQSPCCHAESWYHKMCMQKYAFTAGYFLKCPLCNDSKKFRKNIIRRGIFIPDSDAKWEEAGSNSFYGFEQHNASPDECIAERCKMRQGRKYCYDENNTYLLVLCKNCGSAGVHECCMQKKRTFICDDCELQPPAKKRKKPNKLDDNSNNAQDINNNYDISLKIVPVNRTEPLPPATRNRISKFIPIRFKIMLPDLTSQKIRVLSEIKRKNRELNHI